MDPSITTAVIVVAGIAAVITAYAIHTVSTRTKRQDQMEMDKFKDNLEPSHRERMAQLAANRDAAIAQYTHQPPSKQIEGKANH